MRNRGSEERKAKMLLIINVMLQ